MSEENEVQEPKSEVDQLKEQLSIQLQKNKALKEINETMRNEITKLKAEVKEAKDQVDYWLEQAQAAEEEQKDVE